MAEAWYVIRSKPNKEEFLAGQLSAYGIKVFYPRIRVKTVRPACAQAQGLFSKLSFYIR